MAAAAAVVAAACCMLLEFATVAEVSRLVVLAGAGAGEAPFT